MRTDALPGVLADWVDDDPYARGLVAPAAVVGCYWFESGFGRDLMIGTGGEDLRCFSRRVLSLVVEAGLPRGALSETVVVESDLEPAYWRLQAGLGEEPRRALAELWFATALKQGRYSAFGAWWEALTVLRDVFVDPDYEAVRDRLTPSLVEVGRWVSGCSEWFFAPEEYFEGVPYSELELAWVRYLDDDDSLLATSPREQMEFRCAEARVLAVLRRWPDLQGTANRSLLSRLTREYGPEGWPEHPIEPIPDLAPLMARVPRK